MRALITGITGFIGSHVAELLVSHGYRVLGIARTGKWRNDAPPILANNCQVHAWDIAHPIPVKLYEHVQAFSPRFVFHFAGMSIPSLCGKSTPTPQARDVNMLGTRHVLDLVTGISPQPKFIFASTVHVYARVHADDPYVTEESAIAPISAYGTTKLECESEILQRVKGEGLRACIARGFHHIGPRQPAGLMLTDWLGQLSKPGCVELTVKSTNSHLDLIDVRDAAVAYKLLAESDQADGTYNLGSGRISRSGDVLQAILGQLGRTVHVVETSPAEQWNAIADIRRLKALGWEPRIRFRDTIASMLARPS